MPAVMKFFFELPTLTTSDLLQKILLFLVLAISTIWWLQLLLIHFRKRPRISREIDLHLDFMYALIIFYFLYNVYWYFFIKINGLARLQWHAFDFYLKISPQLFVVALVGGLFLVAYARLKKMIKNDTRRSGS